MVVNLAAHAFHLLMDDLGDFALPFGFYTICLLRKHSQRRLQAVGQVSGFGQRPLHRFLAMFEQRIQIVHQRLHFCGIASVDPAFLTIAHRRQTRS